LAPLAVGVGAGAGDAAPRVVGAVVALEGAAVDLDDEPVRVVGGEGSVPDGGDVVAPMLTFGEGEGAGDGLDGSAVVAGDVAAVVATLEGAVVATVGGAVVTTLDGDVGPTVVLESSVPPPPPPPPLPPFPEPDAAAIGAADTEGAVREPSDAAPSTTPAARAARLRRITIRPSGVRTSAPPACGSRRRWCGRST
jgi:hypothetical protein